MALVHVHFFSAVLGMQRQMDVILPQQANGVGMDSGMEQGKIPVLYLLHGGSDDHTIWQRRTSIERYALERGIAVILPSTDLGFYTDMKHGPKFFTFFSEELPKIVHEFFPHLATDREHTFIAGLSMGGFGAVKLGILCPEKFAAVGSLSGMLDVCTRYERGDIYPAFYPIYGDTIEDVRGTVNDLPYQMEQALAKKTNLPKFYLICGTEDFLYDINTDFRDRFADRIDLKYDEEPGIHEWGFWDRNILRILDWLPLSKED